MNVSEPGAWILALQPQGPRNGAIWPAHIGCYGLAVAIGPVPRLTAVYTLLTIFTSHFPYLSDLVIFPIVFFKDF